MSLVGQEALDEEFGGGHIQSVDVRTEQLRTFISIPCPSVSSQRTV